MDLLLMFFLLALLLQGIKALVNYLLNSSEHFNETILSGSSEQESVNLLSIPVTPEKQDEKVPTPVYDNKPRGKEVFLPTPFHQSA